ncbi:universal stress protein [Rhizobium sp. EC-SD404]|uniref:universal stress protein n=1 Tax=Rhizobium sp. EC-SD404 TaxID=2038389 RepID=UPI0012520DC3|nr:universal stress protein [Rhizobium sp. EC-SD404]VVT30306.1 Universal stress protein UspA [Rhizobium sp. EC-SD404]
MVSRRLSREEGHRRKFMAVLDDTPECERAVRYAAMRAKNSGGGLVLLFVVEPSDFQHWLGVEEIMRAEAFEEAESLLAKSAGRVRETIGIDAETVVREGSTRDEINALIEEDKDIAILVLAAGSAKDGPGPLVSAIGGRGAGAFPVPVTVIPSDLSDDDIDALS